MVFCLLKHIGSIHIEHIIINNNQNNVMNSPTFQFSKMKHNNIVVLTSISNININKKQQINNMIEERK